MAKILIDTSVWIEFFRRHEPCFSVVTRLIDEEQVCCTGIILAELMQGAKSDKELAVLADFPQVFEFISESPDLWAAAGRLSFNLRRSGHTIGHADCFIATAAAQAGVPLATLDTHFEKIKKTAKISLYPIEGKKLK